MAHEIAAAPLGIEFGEVREDGGHVVKAIFDGGTAFRAGLRVGDAVFSIGGEPTAVRRKGWSSGTCARRVGVPEEWEISRAGERLRLSIAFEPSLITQPADQAAPAAKQSQADQRRAFQAFQHGVMSEIDSSPITSTAKVVGRHLVFDCLHRNPESPDYMRAWISITGLAARTGNDRKTIRQALRLLEIEGHLKITPAKAPGDRTYYDLIWKAAARADAETTPDSVQPDDYDFENEIDEADDQVEQSTASTALMTGPVAEPASVPPRMAAALASGAAVSLRRSPEALRAGASPATLLTAEEQQAERQRARLDYELAQQPLNADARVREVIARMGARAPTFDPGPSFEGSQGSVGDSALPPMRGEKW
jgi:hypothetical protein